MTTNNVYDQHDLETALRVACRAFAYTLSSMHHLHELDKEIQNKLDKVVEAAFLDAEIALQLKGAQRVCLHEIETKVRKEWAALSQS